MIEVAGYNEECRATSIPTRSVSPPPPPPPPQSSTKAVDPLNSAAITATAAIPTQSTSPRLTRDIPSVIPLLVLSASHRRRRPVLERPTTKATPASPSSSSNSTLPPKKTKKTTTTTMMSANSKSNNSPTRNLRHGRTFPSFINPTLVSPSRSLLSPHTHDSAAIAVLSSSASSVTSTGNDSTMTASSSSVRTGNTSKTSVLTANSISFEYSNGDDTMMEAFDSTTTVKACLRAVQDENAPEHHGAAASWKYNPELWGDVAFFFYYSSTTGRGVRFTEPEYTLMLPFVIEFLVIDPNYAWKRHAFDILRTASMVLGCPTMWKRQGLLEVLGALAANSNTDTHAIETRVQDDAILLLEHLFSGTS